MVLYSDIHVTDDTRSLQSVNESHDASPASERRDGMTLEIKARGTGKSLSPIRYLIFLDGEEVACFKGYKSRRGRLVVRHVTLYSNVMSGETTGENLSEEEVERRTQKAREAIRGFIDGNEEEYVFFSEDVRNRFYSTRKTWTTRVPSKPGTKG